MRVWALSSLVGRVLDSVRKVVCGRVWGLIEPSSWEGPKHGVWIRKLRPEGRGPGLKP